MFIRAFAVALALGALWWSGSSFGVGLGLGDIRIESALASPLKAIIPLRGLAEIDLDPEQFTISVDSDTRANIQYRLERIDADTATLILYTRESITEPLFQFRVEVEWDRRIVARSYDVFIDPPAYAVPSSGAGTVTEETSVDSASAAQGVATTVVNAGEVAAVPAAGAGAAAPAPAAIDPAIRRILQLTEADTSSERRREYGPTIDGNSIWRVARAVATDNPDFNIYQWMYATWKVNPDAFYESNMHRLKMNELLVVPLEREVAQISRGAAWRAYSTQLALLQSAAGGDADASRSSGEADAAESEAQADAVPDAIAAVSSPAGDTEKTPGLEKAVSEQVSVDAVVREQIASEAVQSPEASTDESNPIGETPLSKIIGLIEEVEREQASIVINPSADNPVEAGPENAIVVATREDADVSPTTSLAETNARPHDDGFVPADIGQPVAIETALEPQQAAAESSAPVTADAASGGWRARRELIEQLPLIGAEAPLAMVGRALQKTDEFVSTSPSWAALAFGGWITVAAMMLLREWRTRHGVARTTPRIRAETVTRDSAAPAAEPAAVRPVTLQPSSYKPPIRLPTGTAQKSDRSEPRIDYNSDEILAKADSFMQARDTDEAVKLLELAIKLQPDRTRFVVRLLEIFHQLKRAGDFESLLRRFRSALIELDGEQQDELRAMHKRLCPQAKPLLDSEAVDDFDSADSADDESEVTARLAADGELTHGDAVQGAKNEEQTATQVVFMNNGVAADGESAQTPGLGPELLDLEETLNEVDVYLAYGLYDNAEELLLKGLEVDPNRVDYLAKLLDTYYATKNLVDFVTCAEALRELGEEANNEYWDKVEIMGYELAPYNKLFAGGKDRGLPGKDFAITRPTETDIDPGLGGDFDCDAVDADAEPIDSVAAGAIEDSQDLDLELDAEAVGDTATTEDVVTGSMEQLEKGSGTDELVVELLAEEDEDPTDLNFDQDATSNVNFEQDAPLLLDQVDDGADQGDDVIELDADADSDPGEGDEEEALDLVASLEYDGATPGEDEEADREAGIGEGLVFATDEIDLDGGFDAVDSEAEHDSEANDTMKFAMADDNEFEQRALAADTDSLEDLRGEDAARETAQQSGQGRILLFPDNNPGQEGSAEFEAEVKMTLQAIRDQLQYLTERLYRQERESCDIRQALAELHEGNNTSAGAAKKKSR